MAKQKHVEVPGSRPVLRPGHDGWHSRHNCCEPIAVTIMMHRANPLPAGFHATPMGHDELAARHGADPSHVAEVVAWAEFCGMKVLETCHASRRVVVEGEPYRVEAVFGVTLHRFTESYLTDRTFRSHHEPIMIPSHLDGKVMAVLGLDTRPIARSYRRTGLRRPEPWLVAPEKIDVPAGAFTPPQIAALYGFPKVEKPGDGQCVAVLELGGGSFQADLSAYLGEIGVSPVPSVASVGVDGARNDPTGDPNSADGEVMLDLDVLASIVPHARIAAYYAPNTQQGFCDGISAVAHDRARKPGVLSISWGGPESGWSGQAAAAMNAALEDCAAVGITVTVAAGDNGSGDAAGDDEAHADFPGSSPWVLCCGGTKLVASDGTITSEVVWNDGDGQGATGGGYSDLFPVPGWQSQSGVSGSGRGVPDVAGDASPYSGYLNRVDGTTSVAGGTSACAPLYAALITLRNQIKGKRSGFINPLLYAHPEAFRDITKGNNGAYSAGPGWDATTGIGVAIGEKVVAL